MKLQFSKMEVKRLDPCQWPSGEIRKSSNPGYDHQTLRQISEIKVAIKTMTCKRVNLDRKDSVDRKIIRFKVTIFGVLHLFNMP